MRILEPRINNKNITIFKNENTNSNDKLKKIYESVRETNNDKGIFIIEQINNLFYFKLLIYNV